MNPRESNAFFLLLFFSFSSFFFFFLFFSFFLVSFPFLFIYCLFPCFFSMRPVWYKFKDLLRIPKRCRSISFLDIPQHYRQYPPTFVDVLFFSRSANFKGEFPRRNYTATSDTKSVFSELSGSCALIPRFTIISTDISEYRMADIVPATFSNVILILRI